MKIIKIKKSLWPEIARIYKEAIDSKNATFETVIPEWNKWNEAHLKICRLAAEVEENLVGFAVLTAVSKRPVYEGVAEVSIYVDESHRRKGIGYQLLHEVIACSENKHIWTLQAGIFPENKSSINLFHRCSFRTVGIREKIGQHDGNWRDVVLMERRSSYL